MPAFLYPNRSQKLLLTQIDLDSAAPEGSAVRIIDELVDRLDTSAIEAHYAVASDTGRPAIHPKTIIKVALFAFYNCRFSLRKMEQDIENNLAYKWLTGDQPIDHSTLGYVLASFCREIVELFTQVVAICKEKELIDFDLLAIDSLKLRANASYKQSKTVEGIEKAEEKVARRIEEVVANVDNPTVAEVEEAEALKCRQERLAEAKALLEDRIRKKGEGGSEKEQQELKGREKINLTDFDTRIMQQANGEKNPAYSVTTTTDVGSDIITHFQVNEEDNDPAALGGAIEGSRETTGERHGEVAADSGFASMENYESLEEAGQEALIPDRRMEVEERGEGAKGEYDRGQFEYRAGDDQYLCPCRKRLEKVGQVKIDGRIYDRYENREACRGCEHREECTKGKLRSVYRDVNEEVRERMREKLGRKRNRSRYNKRAHAAESPYGQVKWNLKFTHVMRRGREKVMMEVGLLFMLFNMMKFAAARKGG